MKRKLIDPITTLADYFSGPQVGHASIGLAAAGMEGRAAERFFAVREAFGISGYDDRRTCERKIFAAFKEKP